MSKSTTTIPSTTEQAPPTLGEVLVKKVLPYIALVFIPIISSLNAVTTRAAYQFVPEGQTPLHPFVLASLRMHLAFISIWIGRWFRNDILLKKYSSSGTADGSTGNDGDNLHTLEEAMEERQQQEDDNNSKTQKKNSSSAVINVVSSLSKDDQQRHKDGDLTNPIQFSPALLDIAYAWLLGLITAGIVFSFSVAAPLVDAVTIAATMAAIPACVYLIGLATGLETYKHSSTLATVLILAGNVLMNHLWRLVSGDFESDDDTVGSNSTNSTTTSTGDVVRRGSVKYFIGVFLLFVSVLCASLYFVVQRPLSKRMSMMDFLFHVYAFASAFSLFASLFPRENIITDQVIFDGLYPWAWIAIFTGGFLQSFVGFLLMSYASVFVGSSLITSLFRAVSPLLIVIESVLFLGETLDQYQVYGGILVIAGIGSTLVPMMSSSPLPSSSSSDVDSDVGNKNTKKGDNLDRPETDESGEENRTTTTGKDANNEEENKKSKKDLKKEAAGDQVVVLDATAIYPTE